MSELNQDGFKPNQPLTFEQLKELESRLRRKKEAVTHVVTEQQVRRRRKKAEE